MNFLMAVVVTFFACFVLAPAFFAAARAIGLYAIVEERTARVYLLFGKVIGTLDEPGLHLLPLKFGPAAFLVNWLGSCQVVDLRVEQQYLRSQPVNSEEGAPMGIGIWYEMQVSNPVAYLFENANPAGSLAANVSNATVRCLSNMKLSDMLETRHSMSRAVREEVGERSSQWGYLLGSIYIRKVHFRDQGMINQIEEKVVNRLRQVTYAIRQDGANQVSIIASTAEREAAIEFAKAAATRPQIVGRALQDISKDPELLNALFEVLQTEKMLEGDARVTLVPEGSGLMTSLMAAQEGASGR